jgi:hypothetical protein
LNAKSGLPDFFSQKKGKKGKKGKNLLKKGKKREIKILQE